MWFNYSKKEIVAGGPDFVLNVFQEALEKLGAWHREHPFNTRLAPSKTWVPRNWITRQILEEAQHSMQDSKGVTYKYESVTSQPMLNELGLPLTRRIAKRDAKGKWDGKSYTEEPCYLTYHSQAVRTAY